MTPPLSAGDLTCEWLTETLRKAGHQVRVASFETALIGAGMVGSTSRIKLSYAETSPGAPAAVVLKVTGEGELSQKLGRIGYGLEGKPGFYASEVFFYREVARRTLVRCPGCYFGWVSEDGGQFTLLLEDISPARSGNELDGCTRQEAELALANLAGLHASNWNAPEFRQPGSLERINAADARCFAGHFARSVRAFMDRHAERHAPVHVRLVEDLAANFADWFLADDQPSAFAHGDYRQDNLLYTDAAPHECVAVDWQSFTIQNPAFDVGYFLGASVPTELRRAAEQELLRVYHDRLLALGVTDYSFEQCMRAYAAGAFFGVKNMVTALRGVTMTDRGRDMLDLVLRRACTTILDHGGAKLLSS